MNISIEIISRDRLVLRQVLYIPGIFIDIYQVPGMYYILYYHSGPKYEEILY